MATRIKLGLLLLTASPLALSQTAQAQTVDITTARTTGVSTSTAGTGNTAADVKVTSTGSVDVSTGAAITLDSNNSVTTEGLVGSTDDNNTTGVLIKPGFTGNVTITSTLALVEGYTYVDSDSDGDFDGPFAQGNNRLGVFLESGTFTGNIGTGTSAAINIEGNDSAGIRLSGNLIGVLNHTGAMSIVGTNSRGIDITNAGRVSGNIDVYGSMTLVGQGAVGLNIGGDVNGAVRVRGAVSVTGFRVTSRPSSAVIAKLDADDLLIGGSAISVTRSISQGLLIDGVGIEDDDDDDRDGVLNETDDNRSASLNVAGSAPAVSIVATVGNLALGSTAFDSAFVNRGSISATGVYDGIDGVAVRIAGNSTQGFTTVLEDGFLNDGLIAVSAQEANATGLDIGALANVGSLLNRGIIRTFSLSDADKDAVGINIDTQATLTSLNNGGQLIASLYGETGDAVVVRDRSGTLTNITNTGTVSAILQATDSNVNDDIIPVAGGKAIAFDLSANTTGVTFLQGPAITAFTDQDATDDDNGAAAAVRIDGDLLFGSGADTLNVTAGGVFGNIKFGAGADSFSVSGGALVAGELSDSDASLALNVTNGTLYLRGNDVALTSATIGSGGILGLAISDDLAEATKLTASGTVSFASGAKVVGLVTGGLPEDSVIRVLEAGSLVGASNVVGNISGEGVSYVYNVNLAVSGSNSNALDLTYRRKTATELGLNAPQASAYEAVWAALKRDTDAAEAFSKLDTASEFTASYSSLLPNYSSAATEMSMTAVDLGARATSNRLASKRASTAANDTFWFQEIGYYVDRDAPAPGVDYRGNGFGFAFGLDGPYGDNGGIVGLSAAFTANSVEEPAREVGELSSTLFQGSLYYGLPIAGLDWDLVVGGGGGKFSMTRQIDIGEDYTRTSDADWWAGEWHASLSARRELAVTKHLFVTPRAGVSYVGLFEQSFEEKGAGVAHDLKADSSISHRVWADLGVEFGARFGSEDFSYRPSAFVGYRGQVLGGGEEKTYTFASGGPSFTLKDTEGSKSGALAGLTFEAGGTWTTFSLNYEAEIRDDLTRHSLNAIIRIRF